MKSGKRKFLDNNSGPTGVPVSCKKPKKNRDRQQSICNTDRTSIASALSMAADDSDLDFSADGFGVALPASDKIARISILPTALNPADMKVAELRRELRSRDMNAAGLKKDLQKVRR